ncbi:hypothetical protein RRG08_003348 [Elysia crispata]|uniref:Uncharacterized protein n=1 Tax=Elysia crispata TaxID=231223 RepID=A0AAE0YC84_9GAST|nr:hypothetical protein RRG08_003348 [Elysia crispata]
MKTKANSLRWEEELNTLVKRPCRLVLRMTAMTSVSRFKHDTSLDCISRCKSITFSFVPFAVFSRTMVKRQTPYLLLVCR